MANLTEVATSYPAGVYQIENGDQVIGGSGGIANLQAQALANRTAFLKAITDTLAGVVLPYAGSAAPSGWLLCYGQAVSRTTYATLFAIIGTTYGAGDGSTTFNLPDMRGRVAAGKDDMGGTAASRITNAGAGIVGTTLGAAGGAQTHTLTIAQMPSHNHNQVASNTSQGGSGLPLMSNSTSVNTGIAGTTQTTGGDGAHNNTQPTIILNYIIKV